MAYYTLTWASSIWRRYGTTTVTRRGFQPTNVRLRLQLMNTVDSFCMLVWFLQRYIPNYFNINYSKKNTFCRCTERELWLVKFSQSTNDVDLFKRQLHSVLVLRITRNVRRPELKKRRKMFVENILISIKLSRIRNTMTCWNCDYFDIELFILLLRL